jgi:DNA-binding ferritin-like protein (Dps family)
MAEGVWVVSRPHAGWRADVNIRDIIDGKRHWRAHTAGVNALPADYRIIYGEMQKYLFKVGPVSLTGGDLLSEVGDLFEGSAVAGRSAMKLIARTSPRTATT